MRAVLRYQATEKGRAVKRAADRRYDASPKGRSRGKRAQGRYRATIKGQISQTRREVRYRIKRTEARIAMLEVALNADP